jgi:hypothetical protein
VGDPDLLEERLDVFVALGAGEEQVLRRDEVVLQRPHLIVGLLKERERAPRQVGLRAAAHAGERVDFCIGDAQ